MSMKIVFSNKLFHFSYKILNALSEKMTFCGISVIFSQYCFMSEIQVLMTVPDFFSRNHFLEGGFTFEWRGFIFK